MIGSQLKNSYGKRSVKVNLLLGACILLSMAFDWLFRGELHQSSLTMQFFHYILLAVDINHSDEYLQNLIQGLISVAGNGTNLIVGYKKTIANEENILEFRLLLGQYFDFPSSRSVIYQCDSGEIIILQMKRKPFSNFLEKNL
jgi:hypothetical protein